MKILSQMLENSTSKHSQEELSFEKSKAALNDIDISATVQGIKAGSDSLTESLPAALKIIKEMLFEPKLDEINFQKAKNEVLLEVQEKLLSANDRALETLYGYNHPIGVTPRLLRQKLNEVKLEDVKEYYKTLVKNSKATVSVSGPISNIKDLNKNIISELNGINNHFEKKLPSAEFPQLKNKKIAVQIENNREQSDIIQLFNYNDISIEDAAAMDVLDNILGNGLGARLFVDLREKQKLAYQANSIFMNKGVFAQEWFMIKTGIKNDAGEITDNIEKSVLGFEKHIQKLIDKSPSQKEVERAKLLLKTTYTKIFATAKNQNERILIGSTTPYDETYYNKFMTSIDKVKPEDVKRVARKYLSQPSVISILTDEASAKKAEAFLKTKGEYKLYQNESIDT
jgi:zinc protease